MTNLADDIKERTSFALKTCDLHIAWFTKHKKEARLLYQSSQVLVIALSALTPVLIMFGEGTPPRPSAKALQALPATIAAILAALSAVFHWRENWVSRVVALEALQSELFKFKTRTSEYYSPEISQQKALDNFVRRVDRINQEELGKWHDLQSQESSLKTKETRKLENQDVAE